MRKVRIRAGFIPTMAFLLMAAVSTGVEAQTRGCQFIGMSKASATDITNLSPILLNAGGPLHVSMLPFEFNPSNPFGNASALVRMVTPGLNGSLHVSLYLKWFPHDAQGLREQAEFWTAWEANRPSNAQVRLRNGFLRRVQQADAWVAATAAWATQNGMGGKLGVTLVPVLEDTCRSRIAYRNILSAIRQQQLLDGVSTALRRSCLTDAQYTFSLGIPLELHGRWDDVKNRLAPGDFWSNDGTDYGVEAFIRDQHKAIARGVHVLLWRAAYNGEPKKRANWAERVVDPFSRPSATERRALRDVLNAR